MNPVSRNIIKIFFAVLVFGAVFLLPKAHKARADVCFLKGVDLVIVKNLQECIKLTAGFSPLEVYRTTYGGNDGNKISVATIPVETPTVPKGNEGAVQPEQPCDIVTDPNCKLPGQESLFPPGSLGEQLFKDTQNAEQAKQTQSIQSLANTEAPKYFCGFSVTCYVVEFLDWASSALLRVPLVMVAGFLDQAVTLALTLPMDQIGFVKQGWKIIRDVSNMFYVLILLWVALGTIFDFPKYNVREILPKLVISALLINFSLPLGTLVINTTNALANVFYQGIVDAGTGINGEGRGRLLADKILENMDFVKIIFASVQADLAAQEANLKQVTEKANKELKNIKTGETDANGNPVTQDCTHVGPINIAALASRGAANATFGINLEGGLATLLGRATGCKDAVLKYLSDVEAAQGYDLLTFARISAIIWKLILIPTLIFVLFAAALFIFIRTISLAFLLIFGPFVFLAWALPETRQYWTQWWDKLLKWSFFMPVLMFMLFLSITMMTTFTGEKSFATTEATQQVLGATAGKTGLATPGFFTANMHFLFMLMLLIGSLTVAEKMGIEMAGQVRGLGQKALGRVKRAAKAPVYAGARITKLNAQDILGRGAGAITSSEQFQRIANMPIFAKTGIGGYAARTFEQGRRAGEKAAATRLIEKYGGDITKMLPEQQAALFATGAPGEITGFYKKLDFEDQQALWRTMNARQKDAAREKLITGGISATEIDQAQGNASAVAEAIRPNLKNLKTADPQKYNEEVINTLRSANYNLKNANPEFIKSDVGQELLKTMTINEMQQIIVTKEGFKALREVIQKQPNLGARIGVSPALNQFLNTGAGKALLRNINMQPDQPPNIAKMIKNLQAQVQNIQGGGEQKTSPPPSGHIPGAT